MRYPTKMAFSLSKDSLLKLSSCLLAINLLLYAFFQLDVNKNIIRILCAGLSFGVFLLNRRVNKAHIICFIAAAYLMLQSGDVSINMAFMIILAVTISTSNVQKVARNYNVIQILLIVIIALCLLSGVVKNTNWTHLGRTRNNFGFSHVNYVGILAFSFVTIYFLSHINVKWYVYVLFLVLSIILFRYSDSRTGFIGTVLFYLLMMIYRFASKKTASVITVIAISVLFVSPFLWETSLFSSVQMNLLLSNRPSIFANYINRHSIIELFFGGSKAGEIDNAFLLMLYSSGILIYLGFYCMTIRAVSLKLEREELVEVSFVVATLGVSLMEGLILRPEIPCAVYFWVLIFKEICTPVNANEVLLTSAGS